MARPISPAMVSTLILGSRLPASLSGIVFVTTTCVMGDCEMFSIAGSENTGCEQHAYTAVAPFSKGVSEAAARGWDPISANFLMPAWVKSHWPKYAEGCERGGRPADPANWRVAKSVFVAKDAATAKAYAIFSQDELAELHEKYSPLKGMMA